MKILDEVEHNGGHLTVIRHGKAVASFAPVPAGVGADVKALLRAQHRHEEWVEQLQSVRNMLEIDRRE